MKLNKQTRIAFSLAKIFFAKSRHAAFLNWAWSTNGQTKCIQIKLAAIPTKHLSLITTNLLRSTYLSKTVIKDLNCSVQGIIFNQLLEKETVLAKKENGLQDSDASFHVLLACALSFSGRISGFYEWWWW